MPLHEQPHLTTEQWVSAVSRQPSRPKLAWIAALDGITRRELEPEQERALDEVLAFLREQFR